MLASGGSDYYSGIGGLAGTEAYVGGYGSGPVGNLVRYTTFDGGVTLASTMPAPLLDIWGIWAAGPKLYFAVGGDGAGGSVFAGTRP